MIVVLMNYIIGLDKENVNIHGNAKGPEVVSEEALVRLMDGVMVTLFVHNLDH